MDLSKFLKKSNNARKIFGKRELKIIEKQLMGIKLTQSEKNRLSRDIREKLRFIKEINKFESEFNLKKGKIIKEMVEEAVEVIKEDPLFKKVKKILLFGSTIDNERTFRSDIDIAVKFDNIDTKEATEFRIRTSGKLPDKVDIQVFNILPDKIKKSILKSNRVLFENE
jgi:predicted nucleotidyltransferase